VPPVSAGSEVGAAPPFWANAVDGSAQAQANASTSVLCRVRRDTFSFVRLRG
jgi:hypothetical protein